VTHTLDRTLDEGSARCRGLYLLTQHVQATDSMRLAGFEPAIPVSERPQTYALDQCFPTAGPWHQLYRAARDSPGICHFNFLSIFHE